MKIILLILNMQNIVKKQKYLTNGYTKITTSEGYTVESSDIVYNKVKNLLFSK